MNIYNRDILLVDKRPYMNNLKIWIFVIVVWLVTLSQHWLAGNLFVWDLLWTQIEIGLNSRITPSFLWREGDFSNSLGVQSNNMYRKNFDLIGRLDQATSENDRLRVIDEYIEGLSDSIENSAIVYEQESLKIEMYKKNAKECESQIKWKNAEFSKAVENYDFNKSELLVEEIADLRACVAKNQVYAKAHTSYASISNSADNLQKRADYLRENREKIAKYYEILKPDLLKELYNISQRINANF